MRTGTRFGTRFVMRFAIKLVPALVTAGGCAAAPLMRVDAVPAAAAQDNHALLVNVGGHADLGLVTGDLAREHTVAFRFVPQHPLGPQALLLGGGEYRIGKPDDAAAVSAKLGGTLIAGGELRAGLWTHVALTWRAGLVELWMNGAPVAHGEADAPSWLGRLPLRLGRVDNRPGAPQLIGLVDDVWILDGALDAAAIALLADGGRPPAGARVLAAFTFEGSSVPVLGGDARVVAAAEGVPPPRAEPNHKTSLDLPFEGEWAVIQGYEGPSTHNGYAAFALDFEPLTDAGREFQGDGKRLEDWPCYGRPLLSPADGVVVRVRTGAADPLPWHPGNEGNTIIIEHAREEFSEFVHAQAGSITHRIGDRVRRGEVVARCGSSGNARTPHLHWAFLRSIDPIVTRPARFTGLEVRSIGGGTWAVAEGVPTAGQLARRAPRQ